MTAAISADAPPVRQPQSATTARPVRRTLSSTMDRSQGFRLRKSITSASMPSLAAAIDPGAAHRRHRDAPGKQVPPVRGLIHEGVHREQHEIHARMKYDGPHAGEGCAYRHSRDRIFRYGRVEQTVAAEFAVEP